MMLLQVQAIDWTTVMTAAIPTVVSLGLTGWVYKVLTTIITDLKGQVSNLKSDVDKLKASENRWFRRYHAISTIISRNKCTDRSCKIHEAYNEFLAKEGETA